MHTWARRGLQTALVTGGLLMLGTGIASADEDVNPDKPASPLDGSVTVPVHIDNNVLGTPFGQKELPGVHRDVTLNPSDVTGNLPAAQQVSPVTEPVTAKAVQTAAPVAKSVQDKAAPTAEDARDQAAPLLADKTKPVTDKLAGLPGGDKLPAAPNLGKAAVPGVDAMDGGAFEGNQVNADIVAPVDISGNAIALLGHAETTNDSSHSYTSDEDVTTSGEGTFVGGNVVDLDWALPVQVTNNAVAGLGTAETEGTSSQDAAATGDIVTDGSSSFLGGNVVAPQLATPVQVDGNAVAGGGTADATSESDTTATSGGTILTSGEESAGGGNAAAAPVAVPAKVNGNAIMGLGSAETDSESTADAYAGDTRTGLYGVPTYVETDGSSSLAGGNVAQPAASGPALLCGNAGGLGGVADATCETASETEAGGTSRSTGENGVLAGAIAAAPVALPVEGFGNSVVGAGEATADADNTVDSTAGGDSYTRGHESVLSGTAANASAAGPVDVFANSVAGAGDASSTALNDATTDAGGHTGTTGDDSLGGGNLGTVPVALPVETFGNTAAAAGGADAIGAETKESTSGGGNNTDDDNGVLASNLATVPVASAAQAFGNGAGLVAFTDAKASNDSEVTAGGDNNATGHSGVGSGNVGHAPVSVPFQFFGNGASGLAKGTQTAINYSDLEAGGDTTSDGAHAAGAGNVVNTPVAGAGQLYAASAAVLGLNHALAGSETETEAGGDTETTGQGSLLSGNVASPQALPLAQSFATTGAVLGGMNSSTATNKTDAESGGDIDTNGDEGFLSGNLADAPVAAIAHPFGNAVSAFGSDSFASGLSNTEGDVGGTSTTSGEFGSLSGIDGTVPAGVNAPVYDVPVEILAQALTESAYVSDIEIGEGTPQLELPVSGGMAPTELPSIAPQQRSMPSTDGFSGVFSGVLTGFAGGLNGMPGQDAVNGVTNQVNQVPGDVHTLPAPASASRSHEFGEVPSVGSLTGTLPISPAALTNVGGRSLPADTPFTGDLFDVPVLQAPQVGTLPVQTPGVQAPVVSDMDQSSLDATRAALAGLFATHPIG